MTQPLIPYLNAIKKELVSRLHPDSDKAMARQISVCTHRILARLITVDTVVPAFRENALLSYKALHTDFTETLGHTDEGRKLASELVRQFENQLDYSAVEPTIQRAVDLLIQNSNPASKLLVKKISEIENTISLQTDAAFAKEAAQQETDNIPGAVLSKQKIEALEKFLREKLGESDTVKVVDVKAVPGGYSKQTLFVDIENNSVLPAQFVIRLDQIESVIGTTVADEFNIIQVMFAAGVPVPRPFALEVDKTILGGAFLVVSRIEGAILGDPLDVAQPNREFALDLAKTLAKMHRVPWQTFGTAISGALISTRQRMQEDIASFQQRWDNSRIPSIALQIGFSWLRANMHLAEGERTLVHKDVGCHNLLVKDNRIMGVLDWETAAIGSSVQDLGYLRHTVTQIMDWDEFVNAYVAAGGFAVTPAQVDFYALWRAVWFLALLTEVKAGFIAGVAPDIQFAYAGEYFFQRVERQLNDMIMRVVVA